MPRPAQFPNATPRVPREAVAVLLAVAATYALSLRNGWTWDDHELIAANPALRSLDGVFLHDVWSLAQPGRSDLYRPLVMATHALGQALSPGPGIEHLVNLLLHLGVVACVAGIARRLGATTRGAWIGAALFGVHAGASESVFWATGRHDLVPALLLLAGWLALLDKRSWLAGALLALTPFAKEPYVLVPLTVVVWGVARRRLDLRALILASAGVGATLAIRSTLGFAPLGAAVGGSPWGPIGAGFRHFVHLLFVPASAAETTLYEAAPGLGVAVFIGCAALAPLVWRLPLLAALAAPLVIWLPTNLAAAQIGIVADRYAYVLFAGVGVLAGVLVERLGRPAWLLPLALAPLTVLRGLDWVDDAHLFGADLAAWPQNPHAAFHVAWDLQERQGDCKSAEPLYRLAIEVEPRAASNLQACLAAAQDWAGVYALGPQTHSVAGAMNTARAAAQLGDEAESLRWSAMATERWPDHAAAWVLYGKVLATSGRWPEAAGALDRAAALAPEDADIARLQAAARERAEGLKAPEPPPGPDPE